MLNRSALQLVREGITGREDGERGEGRGDYSREAIILSISIKRGAIIRGTRLIEVRLPLEEMRYIKKLDISKPFVILVKILSVPLLFGVISRFQCNYKAHIKTYLFKPLYW